MSTFGAMFVRVRGRSSTACPPSVRCARKPSTVKPSSSLPTGQLGRHCFSPARQAHGQRMTLDKLGRSDWVRLWSNPKQNYKLANPSPVSINALATCAQCTKWAADKIKIHAGAVMASQPRHGGYSQFAPRGLVSAKAPGSGVESGTTQSAKVR